MPSQTDWDAIEKAALVKAKNKLSSLAIGAAIRRGKDFNVSTNAQRKAVIAAARFMGAHVVTRAVVGGEGYKIYVLEAAK